jgi:hypothetical protein
MENLEWVPVYYNGIETNIEVTKNARFRKLKVDWMIYNNLKYGEIDLNNIKTNIQGYKSLTIQIKGQNKKQVRLHQLIAAAFLNYKFQGNKLVIDHIDSDKLNNNLSNLRVVTQRENLSKERTKKSGLPVGVSWRKRDKKYMSYITINNKLVHLGHFNTIEEASYAYQQKLKSI